MTVRQLRDILAHYPPEAECMIPGEGFAEWDEFDHVALREGIVYIGLEDREEDALVMSPCPRPTTPLDIITTEIEGYLLDMVDRRVNRG